MIVRIALFLLTNFSVIALLGCMVSLLGCCIFSSNLQLMCIASIFGMGGAFISLLLSKSIALSAVHGVVVNTPSNEIERWLLQIVHNHAKKLNVVPPKLAVYTSQDMNAFATGARCNAALIAVSSNLIHSMNKESIEAVIAHEMHHIASGDMITMTLVQGIVNTFVIYISRSLSHLIYYWISLINHEDSEKYADMDHYNVSNSIVYMIISLLLELFFGVFASVIVFGFSRYREFYADAGAAKLVGREKMIAALRELKYNYESDGIDSSIMTLCVNNAICNNKKTDFLLYDLFSSHPSLDKRIKALQCGLYFK